MPEIVDHFSIYAAELEVDNELYEELRLKKKELEKVMQRVESAYALVRSAAAADRSAAVDVVFERIAEVKEPLASFGASFSSRSIPAYRKKGQWASDLQTLVRIAAVATFLRNDTLLSKAAAAELLGIQDGTEVRDGAAGDSAAFDDAALSLDLEDYLGGVLGVPDDLSRLCTAATLAGDFALPSKIAAFTDRLSHSFSLLRLKNDFLRRRFDSVKYASKRIEGVVYDLTIRGLVGGKEGAAVGVNWWWGEAEKRA
jgi:hypothetical protein